MGLWEANLKGTRNSRWSICTSLQSEGVQEDRATICWMGAAEFSRQIRIADGRCFLFNVAIFHESPHAHRRPGIGHLGPHLAHQAACRGIDDPAFLSIHPFLYDTFRYGPISIPARRRIGQTTGSDRVRPPDSSLRRAGKKYPLIVDDGVRRVRRSPLSRQGRKCCRVLETV